MITTNFKEIQRINKWYIWIIPILLIFYSWFKIYVHINDEKHLSSSIWGAIIILIIGFFLFIINLKTIINQDGLYLKFFPFHRKTIFYPWKGISKIQVRKYSPFKEFGGWGFRIGDMKCYTVSGNYGIEVELTNGNKFLIGTGYPEKVESMINELKIKN